MSTTIQINIAILGGGPAGLTLARLLQTHGIRTTVFERDASASSRSQGGTLDLHDESGQLALKRAGLWEECVAKKLVRYEADELRLLDKNGTTYIDESDKPEEGEYGDREPVAAEGPEGQPRDRPEMDRNVLRKLLLESLDEGTVRWNHTLNSVTRSTTQPGTYDLHFSNAPSSTGFHLVVGADGGWSRVRPLLSEQRPFYSGISGVELHYKDVAARHPEIAKLVGAGSLMVPSDDKLLMAQRLGDGSMRLYVFLRAPESWVDECGVDFKNPVDVRTQLVGRYFNNWAQEMKEMLEACDDEGILPRTLFMLPVGHRWKPRAGITLIGDAAHLMTPFAGEGVNLAMLDALTLAKAIVDHKAALENGDFGGLTEATKTYEDQMFEYSSRKTEETARNLDLLFQEGLPVKFVDAMEEMMAGPPPQ